MNNFNSSTDQLLLLPSPHVPTLPTLESCWLQPCYVKMPMKEESESLLTLKLLFPQVHKLFPSIMKSVDWQNIWIRWDSIMQVMDVWLVLVTLEKSIKKSNKPSRQKIFVPLLFFQETETLKVGFIHSPKLTSLLLHHLLSLLRLQELSILILIRNPLLKIKREKMFSWVKSGLPNKKFLI